MTASEPSRPPAWWRAFAGLLAAGLVATASGAALAWVPGLDVLRSGAAGLDDRWTLGLPVPRFGEATAVVVLAALLQRVLRPGRADPEPPWAAGGWIQLARVFWSTLLALGAFAVLGTDVPRRRGVLMAVGAAAAFEAVGWLGSRGRRTGAITTAAAAVAAALAIAAMVRSDAAPTRTWLPPPAAVSRPATGATCILLLTLDTTRARDLGPYGSTRGASPTLDALAAESVTFLHATAEAPHTHPSIGALLTACPPRVHGSVSGAAHLADGVSTLAEHVRAYGYRTAGFLDNPWLGAEFGLARGYEHLDRRTELGRIERWLDQDDPRPFLLHVHYFHPHGPYELRDNAFGRALVGSSIGADRGGPRARVGDRIAARVIQRGEVPGRHGFDPPALGWIHDVYLSEIRAMDDDVAALLRAVEERVPPARLLTVVAADHGEEFGERGGLHHSHTLFEELLHVPLMIRAAGVAPARFDGTVGLIDVAPTILEQAGLPPLPAGSGRPIELQRPGPPRLVISERVRQGGRRLTAVRRGRWKLHVRQVEPHHPLDGAALEVGSTAGHASVALFDLHADPGETRDVSGEHPTRVDELLEQLRAWERDAAERSERLRSERPGDAAAERAISYRTRAMLRSLGY